MKQIFKKAINKQIVMVYKGFETDSQWFVRVS